MEGIRKGAPSEVSGVMSKFYFCDTKCVFFPSNFYFLCFDHFASSDFLNICRLWQTFHFKGVNPATTVVTETTTDFTFTR